MIHGLALCPGAGGLDLGIELALGPTYRPVVYVERDPYVAGVLAARMQDRDLAPAPVWDDLATFDGRPWRGRVDLISAGFPCQPHSGAGKRRGTTDPRWLWTDIDRIIGEVGPRLVVLENVRGLLTSSRALALGQVLADLADRGYVGAWRCLRAADVGAPHRRDRVFVVAVAADAIDRPRDQPRRTSGASGQAPPRPRTNGAGGPVPHADGRRREGQRLAQLLGLEGARGHEPDRRGGGGQWGPDGPWSTWATEPDVGRVVDGMAARLDLARASRRSRLRATGNGCVPQQAAVAIRSLIKIIEEHT